MGMKKKTLGIEHLVARFHQIGALAHVVLARKRQRDSKGDGWDGRQGT